MVELSLSDKNTYKMNGKTVEETFGTPYDDDDSEIPAHQKKSIQRLESLLENIFKEI